MDIAEKTEELETLTYSINKEWKEQMRIVRDRLGRTKRQIGYDLELSVVQDAIEKRDISTVRNYLRREYERMNYFVVAGGEFYFQ
jgi:hypothetical protein